MKFRLIYDGPLQPSQRDPENGGADPVRVHKHNIRKQFHSQLKELWRTNKFLSEHKVWPSDYGGVNDGTDARVPLIDVVSQLYVRDGFRFVPLVRDDWKISCSLDILFLRRDIPGSVIRAGDLDNRLKTLIDALRMPFSGNELAGCGGADAEEDPFFCLMEDDRQVTALAVESDTLLDPISLNDADNRRVRLVVSVEIKPYETTMFNLSFG